MNTSGKKVRVDAIFGVIFGVVSIILGCICFGMDVGQKDVRHTSYGGDAYTGIQNASADAANNVSKLADIAKFGFGSVLLMIGLALIVYSSMKFTEAFLYNTQNNAPMQYGSVQQPFAPMQDATVQQPFAPMQNVPVQQYNNPPAQPVSAQQSPASFPVPTAQKRERSMSSRIWEGAPFPVPAPPVLTKYKICSVCKAKNPASSYNCSECGMGLPSEIIDTQAPLIKTCPKCGTDNPISETVCKKCFAKI